MGEEAVSTTPAAYVWISTMDNTKKYILVCHADSPENAIDNIMVRFSRINSDTDQLIKMEAVLRQTPPQEMDFLDGVGILLVTQDHK